MQMLTQFLDRVGMERLVICNHDVQAQWGQHRDVCDTMAPKLAFAVLSSLCPQLHACIRFLHLTFTCLICISTSLTTHSTVTVWGFFLLLEYSKFISVLEPLFLLISMPGNLSFLGFCFCFPLIQMSFLLTLELSL